MQLLLVSIYSVIVAINIEKLTSMQCILLRERGLGLPISCLVVQRAELGAGLCAAYIRCPSSHSNRIKEALLILLCGQMGQTLSIASRVVVYK
jgi:hypothetical protein